MCIKYEAQNISKYKIIINITDSRKEMLLGENQFLIKLFIIKDSASASAVSLLNLISMMGDS